MPGKVALVTGGTRGIGRVIAARLADLGCRVFVCGRNAPEDIPAAISFRAADVRKADQATALIDAIADECGQFDILINNAGGSPACAAETASAGFVDAILKLNLVAPLYLAQAAHRHMRGRGGSIVNIASVSGIRPSPGTAIYGAAKAGLLNLTQSLAQEWGADKVRVNAIIVGLASTENAEATYGDAAAREQIAASLPLGRMCEGRDVADAVAYLVSPLASYVSGARLNVDGGGEKPYFLDLVKGN